LEVLESRLGLGTKIAIRSEPWQRKARIHESLLDFFDCLSSASNSQRALVVEASLQHRVTGEAHGPKVVTVTNCALEHY